MPPENDFSHIQSRTSVTDNIHLHRQYLRSARDLNCLKNQPPFTSPISPFQSLLDLMPADSLPDADGSVVHSIAMMVTRDSQNCWASMALHQIHGYPSVSEHPDGYYFHDHWSWWYLQDHEERIHNERVNVLSFLKHPSQSRHGLRDGPALGDGPGVDCPPSDRDCSN